MNFVQKLDLWVDKITGKVLVLCIFLMLTLSVLGIIFRWFQLSYAWMDPFVRHLVFMSTFLGGVLATGRGTHIGIDIFAKYLEANKNFTAQRMIQRIIALASFCTLIWLTKASYDFMLVELKYGKISSLGLHTGVLVGIIPVGFFFIGIRFFNIFLLSFKKEERS